MIFAPLAGKRREKVTERRTRKDWAKCVGERVDTMYPDAGADVDAHVAAVATARQTRVAVTSGRQSAAADGMVAGA